MNQSLLITIGNQKQSITHNFFLHRFSSIAIGNKYQSLIDIDC